MLLKIFLEASEKQAQVTEVARRDAATAILKQNVFTQTTKPDLLPKNDKESTDSNNKNTKL